MTTEREATTLRELADRLHKSAWQKDIGLIDSDREEAASALREYADHLSRAAEPVGWQYFYADLWHLSESDEPWRSKGMPVREVFIHPSEGAQTPALETRHVDGVILKWHGIPVRVTGTVSTSAGNMKLIDAMAKANRNG